MNFFQKTGSIWQNVSIVQKAVLVSIVIAVVLIGGLFVYWAQVPDMKVLYSGLDPEAASKITDKISEKGIVYKLNTSGTTVYVPSQEITQLRLDLARQGLPDNGQKGYSIFDEEKVGISPFVQNINLKRALQEELAKSIQMIEGVLHARIHIVSPENSFFSSQKAQTSASVILKLKPGYSLSQQNIAAISHIITGSVEGLQADNVTIVDSQGRLLSTSSDEQLAGGSGTVADYRERVEQNLANKVQDMLTAVLGPGRAMVKISAEVNMTSSNVAKEIYDAASKVPSKEEITNESEIESKAAAAEGEQAPGNSKKNETIVTEYLVPKTVEQTVELAGEIKSLTVAAFVDLSPEEPVAAQEQTATDKPAQAATAAAGPIMEIAEVQDIIRKAVGPKLTEDGLKVVNVKFNRPSQPLIEEEKPKLNYLQIARQASLGIMSICALIVLKIFSGAGKKASAAAAAQLPAAMQHAGMLPSGAEAASESLMLRRQIANSLRNNPEQVKQLFASWLQEKGA